MTMNSRHTRNEPKPALSSSDIFFWIVIAAVMNCVAIVAAMEIQKEITKYQIHRAADRAFSTLDLDLDPDPNQ